MTKHGNKTPRILCAGGAVQDIVMRVDQFPAAGSKVQASEFLITSGGQAGNAAVAVARLGGNVSYLGYLGDKNDEVANRIIKTFEDENIDVSGAIRVPGASSSVSLILIDGAGEKMIATRRDKGLGQSEPSAADAAAAVADADAVVLDNRYANVGLPVCQAAKGRGIPRVLDLDKPAPPDDPLVAGCTHVISSAESMRDSTGLKDLSAALLKYGEIYQGFLAVTDGPDGVYWRDGGKVHHMPAHRVEVVDTLGAGDTFHGAFALRLVETGDEVEAMRFASAAAAIKCTRFGGLMGAATRDEVEAFLEKHQA
ncbi:MAG: PfkB family carbohydrate kinase [Pseudolabrys sp.]|nr:PfkB family carbohydrate kinase [Pseudolabrys sp.]